MFDPKGFFLPYTALLLGVGLLAGCASTAERNAFEAFNTEVARSESVPAPVEHPAVVSITLGEEPSFGDYLRVTLARNPSVNAARAEWEAALERVPQARALPDPMLVYGYYVESVETRLGPQRQRASLTQAFPWFGTLGQQADRALAEAKTAQRRYEATLETVVADLADAYADFFYLGAALQITEDNLELLAGWETILRARYETGAVTYSDLIKVQVELGTLEDRARTLEDLRGPRQARLRALLDLQSDTQLPLPRTLPDLEPLPDPEDLRAQLESRNPNLLALDAVVETADRRLDLARKRSWPGLAVGVDWIQTDPLEGSSAAQNGKDAWVARIAVQLPVWTGPRAAGRREATAMRSAALDRRAATLNRINTDFHNALFAFRDAERKVSLYGDALIPKGAQSLEAAFTAFESGNSDFLGVLDAERQLLEFGLSLERARADRLRARIRLSALVGRAAGSHADPGSTLEENQQ